MALFNKPKPSPGLQVQDLMSARPIFVNETDTVSLILNLFETTRISGAPVFNLNGDYVGVISKTDIAGPKFWSKVETKASLETLTAKDIMNDAPMISVYRTDPVEKAVELMLDNNIHRVFVTDREGRLIGIFSTFDAIKALSNNVERNAPSDSEEPVVTNVSGKENIQSVVEEPASELPELVASIEDVDIATQLVVMDAGAEWTPPAMPTDDDEDDSWWQERMARAKTDTQLERKVASLNRHRQ